MSRFELMTIQKLWLTQIVSWQHNQLSYGMCSINLLLYSNVSQTIFILQVTEGQVTYSYCLPHPPGYGRTSYISVLSILRTHYVSLPCPTYMIMEGQVTYPFCLPHPPGYRRTHYISLLHITYPYISAPPPWLQKDKLHIPTVCRLRKDTLHISTICPTRMITEGQVT